MQDPNPIKKRYRLYIDESGDHTYKDVEQDSHRYLALLGCVIDFQSYKTTFQPSFQQLRNSFFPREDPDDDPVIFHREDIVHKRRAFWRLRDPEFALRFDTALLEFLSSQSFVIICIVIDKKTHLSQYKDAAFHPYHYCLQLMLERYCGLLNYYNAERDVIAEARGGKEDRLLSQAYRYVYSVGTHYHSSKYFQSSLTSKELKLKGKDKDIAGLQIADILAHPCKQDVLIEENRLESLPSFAQKICECIASKYNRRFDTDRVKGYGKVFL